MERTRLATSITSHVQSIAERSTYAISKASVKNILSQSFVALILTPATGASGRRKVALALLGAMPTHFKDQCESAWRKAANSAGPLNGFWVARLLAAKVRTGA
jgi:hypothetical protein